MGEITNVLQQNGLFITQNFEEIGLEIHVAAWFFLASFYGSGFITITNPKGDSLITLRYNS